MSDPLVSVFVNNYNYGRFLAAALDSALDQDYRRSIHSANRLANIECTATTGGTELIRTRVLPQREAGREWAAAGHLLRQLDATLVANSRRGALGRTTWLIRNATSEIAIRIS
jgi:hypothetical protein